MSDQLICSACGFSNEPERIYCHSCGAKLDRSLIPVAETEKGRESTKAAQRRIRRMTNPGFSIAQFSRSLMIALFWGAVVAAVFLISQKPADVPEPNNDLPRRMLHSELSEATQSPSPRAIGFSEADINTALKQSLKRAPAEGGVPGVEFQRAFAMLTPGVIHIGVQQALWGYPIYSSVAYKLAIVDGKFTPSMIGGSLGRLPIHPELMQHLDFSFRKLWSALQRERAQMEKMQNVSIRQGQVFLVTKGAGSR